MDDLKTICEAIEKGYEAELTMLDDRMIGHVQDLADSTKEILSMIAVQKYLRDANQDLRRDNAKLVKLYEQCHAALQDKTAMMFDFYHRMFAAETALAKFQTTERTS